MQTDNLIRALTADAEDKITPLGRALVFGLLSGLAVSLPLYFLILGPRPQLLAMIAEPRILFKLGFPLALVACAGITLLRLVRPGADLRLCIVMLALLALALAAAIVGELVSVPQSLWETGMMGRYPLSCTLSIPMLSAAPLVAAFVIMRQGAPAHPALAGAGVGFLASAIGAAIYATHCPDDSPLFLAAWYLLAIACVTALGAIAGQRLLRW